MNLQCAWQGHAVAALTCASALPAHAGVTEFTDRAEWETAVGAFTTVNFTGFPEFTVITDQYADLGVFFTDANDVIRLSCFQPTGRDLVAARSTTSSWRSARRSSGSPWTFPGSCNSSCFKGLS